MGKRGFKTVTVRLAATSLTLYGGQKLLTALEDIVSKASLYEGVKLAQIMEAVYLQGKKDGARHAFDQLDSSIAEVKKTVPHNRPGRPRKKAK